MNPFRAFALTSVLVLLAAADCGPSGPEAPPTEACAGAGLCDGDDRAGLPGLPGAGGVGGVEIVDDGRPVVRGVYLDDLDEVLSSSSSTEALLQFLRAEGFERISCYDLGTIFDDATASSRLATFLGRARREAGVVEVAAVRGTAAGFVDVLAWNARVDDGARFDVFTLEHEWWNGAGTFVEHVEVLRSMQVLAARSPRQIVVDDYLGWFMNPGDGDGDGVTDDVTAAQMAAVIVQETDRVMLHAYRSAPDLSYLASRLRLLSAAAAAAGRTVEVVVIFSAEEAFMGPWLETHSLDDAWADLLRQARAADPAITDHLDLVGFQVFAASHAMGR